MRRIFSKLLYEMEEERSVMLVTVIADKGSAPRGAGAAMLVGERGRITGTIGGGAVEYQSERKAIELLHSKTGATHEFVLRPNDKEDIGMQCGGNVTVLFEYVDAGDMRWSLLAGAVCDRIEAGKHGWLILPLDGSVPSLYGEEGLLCGDGVSEAERAALCTTHSVITETCYAEPLPLFNRVVIFGGGHIAQALTPMLAAVDFRGIVLDNRPDYAKLTLFKGAEDAMVCDYNNIADAVTLTAEDYVVVMTNGHSGDLAVEEQVLRSPHAYLGVVGSRSKITFVNKTLMERGIPEEALHTVHTPIGTPIKAVTPAEIAVSILGELILCRAEIREGGKPEHHPCPVH